jgi:hypothetical protein
MHELKSSGEGEGGGEGKGGAKQRGVGKFKGFNTTKFPGQTLSGAAHSSAPRAHALLTGGAAFRRRFVNGPEVLSIPQCAPENGSSYGPGAPLRLVALNICTRASKLNAHSVENAVSKGLYFELPRASACGARIIPKFRMLKLVSLLSWKSHLKTHSAAADWVWLCRHAAQRTASNE